MAAAAELRRSYRLARVIAAPAAASRGVSRQICDRRSEKIDMLREIVSAAL